MTSPLRRGLLLAGGALVIAAAGSVAGCGFRPRGNADLPFATLYTTFQAGSALGADFRRELHRSTSTRVVEVPSQAEVQLRILGESREREIVAYSSVGTAREYQLSLRLQFRATDGGDHEFIGPSEMIMRRDISATDNQLTARTDEEALLYRDMRKDMVQQLLRRLAAIRMKP